MPTIALELDERLYSRLKTDSAALGETINEFIVKGLSQALRDREIFEAIRANIVSNRSSREGFERLMSAVPDASPIHPGDIKE